METVSWSGLLLWDRIALKSVWSGPVPVPRSSLASLELKDRNACKKLFFEAVKVARKWRLTGQLAPAEICETGFGSRLLKRF